jgi:hypothetical protein
MSNAIAVIGGVYNETCSFPWRTAVLGSGGRAACVLANLGHSVNLFSAADIHTEGIFNPIADSFLRISCDFRRLDHSASFYYSHPLAQPEIRYPRSNFGDEPLTCPYHNKTLCFGMLEGMTSVSGDRVVYDPQSPDRPLWFRTRNSAKQLAYILNEREAKALTGETAPELAGALIASREAAEVVIIKRGPLGSLVWTPQGMQEIPCYRTPIVYKIGSGDVFSAVFFLEWAVNNRTPIEAAHGAARATAIYCATGGEPQVIRPGCYDLEKIPWATASRTAPAIKSIYLAGPFFTTSQRWLIGEAYRTLVSFGMKVFSPLHDVGIGLPETVVAQDLRGIDDSSLVYAIVDGADSGTLFEIGYARAKGIKVIVLAESQDGESLTMLSGSGCRIYSDFSASLYGCCWE